jgi:anion-transporting  ArsA/GET3 family ATPase
VTLADLIAPKAIVICVGPGGVGKTSVAAAIAMHAARGGRRTLVCTIDPAKRLASSLGLSRLDHEERRVPSEKLAPAGWAPRGELFAMMLDQQRAMDEFVARRVSQPDKLRRILENRIYRSIAGSLAGAQEYAAMAKLHALDEEGRYDLIVLDTPPTSNALDFLDAPRKITEAVDSPAIQWFIRPYVSAGRFSLKLVSFGGAFVLKRIARFVGSEFVEDMAGFLVEFNEVMGGFGERATAVAALLRDPKVTFVLVGTPDPLAVDEAIFFYRRLREQSMPFGAFVLNRVHASLGPPPPADEVIIRLTLRPELRGCSAGDLARASKVLRGTYRNFEALAAANQAQIARLAAACGTEHLYVQVPFCERDVYDVDGLSWLGRHLFAEAPPPPIAAPAPDATVASPAAG